MSGAAIALRLGLARGLIELRQSFRGRAVIGQMFWPLATLVAIYFLRHRTFRGSGSHWERSPFRACSGCSSRSAGSS